MTIKKRTKAGKIRKFQTNEHYQRSLEAFFAQKPVDKSSVKKKVAKAQTKATKPKPKTKPKTKIPVSGKLSEEEKYLNQMEGLRKAFPAPVDKPDKDRVRPDPDLPITVKREDIPSELLYNAFRNLSFRPEGRGKIEQDDYIRNMNNTYERLSKFAITDEQKATLKDEMKRYQENYLKKTKDLLGRKSSMASSVITGGSNFPQRRMEKIDAIDHRKTGEFLDWQDKAFTSMRRKMQKQIPQETIKKAWMNELEKDLHRATIKEVKGEKVPQWMRSNTRQAVQGRIQTLINNGKTEEAEEALKFIDNWQDKNKKTAFTKRNEIWKAPEKARAMKKHIVKQVGKETIKTFKGGKIVNNKDMERVQIFFDEIPNDTIRKELKSNGYRFSRANNNAWQRKNTINGISNSKYLIEKLIE